MILGRAGGARARATCPARCTCGSPARARRGSRRGCRLEDVDRETAERHLERDRPRARGLRAPLLPLRRARRRALPPRDRLDGDPARRLRRADRRAPRRARELGRRRRSAAAAASSPPRRSRARTPRAGPRARAAPPAAARRTRSARRRSSARSRPCSSARSPATAGPICSERAETSSPTSDSTRITSANGCTSTPAPSSPVLPLSALIVTSEPAHSSPAATREREPARAAQRRRAPRPAAVARPT